MAIKIAEGQGNPHLDRREKKPNARPLILQMGFYHSLIPSQRDHERQEQDNRNYDPEITEQVEECFPVLIVKPEVDRHGAVPLHRCRVVTFRNNDCPRVHAGKQRVPTSNSTGSEMLTE